jgi:hypothetical protein
MKGTRLFLTIVLAGTSLLPAAARATSLSTSIIGLFPKNVGEFAYADLRAARQFKWFAELKAQMLPPRFKEFEKFLASAGVDPDTQMDEMAWAFMNNGPAGDAGWVPNGDQMLGIALGQFNPAAADAFFVSQRVTPVKIHGFSLYAFGSGDGPQDLFFFFIDSNTAAFGQRVLLERLINVRYGLEDGLLRNDGMFPLINEMNGRGIVWSVLDPAYTRLAMHQLLPDTSQFPQAGQLMGKVKSLLIDVRGGSTLDARFQAICATTDDANTFAALLQGALLYQRYQSGQTNAALGSLLDGAKIAPHGDRLQVDMSLTQEQMVTLIRNKTFALQM